ncbi:MAG: glycosyltransferase 87 family protein [Sphingomonas bacterium]|nr:glycosyltransferase 87 family protein [Sphingomonas bacterium]
MTSGRPLWPWVAAALVLLFALALIVPVDHDEGQYVAAAHLIATGYLPYRDFSYLQTPLQPFLIAPLAWLAPGWLLVAARLANALAVALAAWLLARTAVRLSKRAIAGPIVIIAVVAVDAMLFAATVARNDAVPMLLFAAALERLFAGQPISPRRAALAGLFLALAASTKVSYALPAAAAAAMALWHARRADRPQVAGLIAGMAVGALPTLLFLVWQTKPFLFGAYHYSIDAVTAWQTLIGTTERLGWGFRARRLAGLLVLGPALLMLVAVAITQSRKRALGEPRPLGISLGVLLIASLLAAILPTPVYRQYLVPLVPPLILLAALRAEAVIAWLRPRTAFAAFAALLLAGSIVAGFVRSVNSGIRAPAAERPLAIERQAHRIGRLGAQAGGGIVAGLDPLLLIDSGLTFDPRFAAGPFLFRAGNLAACADAALCPVTFAHLDRLDQAPPRFLVTGSERKLPPGIPGGLDGALDRWALHKGYAATPLGAGRILWTAPR